MSEILHELRQFQSHIHNNAKRKGWWDTPNSNAKNFMLMVSEISEAMEADREGNPFSDKIPEFSSIEEELADTVIRILDFAQGNKMDIIGTMITKANFNHTRKRLHGGKGY